MRISNPCWRISALQMRGKIFLGLFYWRNLESEVARALILRMYLICGDQMAEEPKSDRKLTACPFYWFALLEQYIEKGDFERAADAQKNLQRFGIKVSYCHPTDAFGRREASHA